MRGPVTVACVQAEPVILDRDATIEKLGRLAAEAAGNDAKLLVFPEAFIPAYPSSVWAARSAGWESRAPRRPSPCSHRESLELPDRSADRLAEIARENERLARDRRQRASTQRGPGRSTTRCSTTRLTGALALNHRKLVPTNHERLVWGQGDGRGPAGDRDAGSAGSAA